MNNLDVYLRQVTDMFTALNMQPAIYTNSKCSEQNHEEIKRGTNRISRFFAKVRV